MDLSAKATKSAIGITDHAQSELTDVVLLKLPKMARQANAKEAIAVVDQSKRRAISTRRSKAQ